MCELVFFNHVNICGRILELTPKMAQIYQISDSPKKLQDLTKIPHSKQVQYWFWSFVGVASS
jgi:hypothetical protein